MKKAMILMLASVFMVGSLALAACGDDDDDAVDNVGACEDLQDTINGLECYEGFEVDLSCDSYANTACDIADYFNCVSDCYFCDEDLPGFDMDKYNDECVPMAEC